MKRLMIGLVLAGFSTSFGAISDDLKIARGEGDRCFAKAFRATRPSDDQKAKAREEQQAVKKVFEDNKENIQAKAADYHAAMMKHPIVMEDAAKAAHALGEAVHPVHAAIFMGSINIINVLSENQRAVFNRTMHRCMKN